MVQTNLFDNTDRSDNRKGIGNGYSIEWKSNKILNVYRGGTVVKTACINEPIDRRRLVVELVLENGVVKSHLAAALGISRQSIDNWVDTYKKSGFEGLVHSYKGSKGQGRNENAERLPTGNKARILEKERKSEREELQEKQLLLSLEELKESERGEKTEHPDIFNEDHGFEENRYAGALIYWGIFQHYFNFMAQSCSFLGRHSMVVYLFAMMLIHNIPSVERLKTVFKREFGKLLGVKQLFSKPVIWKMIHDACHLGLAERLKEAFFRRQARKGMVALYWLYIDGHFIPHYGKEKIHAGYYTQRDKMMPGQTELFVHDCHGRIVYFELQEGKGDLKEMMLRMSKKWRSYMGDQEPIIIADRECWGVEHFIALKDHRFVTWEKFSQVKELASISDKLFGDEFKVNDKAYQVYESSKIYRSGEGNSIKLRRIVIWNLKTNKRVACVTPLDELEDAETLARAMLGRWGSSENSFKHMGKRWNMHYNPVLDTIESENQQVYNPEYKQLQKDLSGLKRKLKKVEIQLGRLPMPVNRDGKLRKSKKRDRLKKEKKDLKSNIKEVANQLKKCSERVNLSEVDSDKTFKKIGAEAKTLWDIAQSLVWNSRKKLVEIFGEYLSDNRDLVPVLEAITTGQGWIRSTPEAIEIRLEPLETPRFKVAQIQLCRALNEKRIRLQNGKRLLYDVGHAPN